MDSYSSRALDERTPMNSIIHNYPEPQIPISPVFSSYSCKWKKQSTPIESVLAQTYKIHVSSGRAAIALALEHSNITDEDEVLVPAYHCESMVSPIRWRKATPVFYKINTDTSIDEQDIESKINQNTKAIIATHYFGFLQNLNTLRKICDKHNILLIEDCAHALFGQKNEIPVGSTGDYAIASSMKFFSVYDGGILTSNNSNINNIILTKPPISFALKTIFNVIERSIKAKRLGIAGKIIEQLLHLKSFVWKTSKRLFNKPHSHIVGPSSSDGGHSLDPSWLHTSASFFSKHIIEHADYYHIIQQRRLNFQLLNKALHHLNGLKPLYSSLPEATVPLVYPVFVEQPSKHFANLKSEGIPIWRFGEFLDSSIDENVCPNSVRLSAHIFQFPCHQELTTQEVKWMISVIVKEFSQDKVEN